MSRTWLSIRVDLVEGRGQHFWPRPGRIFAAARSHTFAQLAEAIDDAFARWDRAHLHQFTVTGGHRIGRPDWEGEPIDGLIDAREATVGQFQSGAQFVYEFDFGDSWTHLCTIGDRRIDPVEQFGVIPDHPRPYWGWGAIPDQYGRGWDSDDGGTPPPPDPGLADLPPLRPRWGPQPG